MSEVVAGGWVMLKARDGELWPISHFCGKHSVLALSPWLPWNPLKPGWPFKRQIRSCHFPTPFTAPQIKFQSLYQALQGLWGSSPSLFPDFNFNLYSFLSIPQTHGSAFGSSNTIQWFLHGVFTTCGSLGQAPCPRSTPVSFFCSCRS